MGDVNRERILIVDDDRLTRNALRDRLEADGFLVADAATGAEAIDSFHTGADLVLLDFCLPDVKGYDLLELMLDSDPDAVIIMLTAHASVAQAVQAMHLGAHHCVEKPFDVEETALLVRQRMDIVRMRRKIRAMHTSAGGGMDSIIGESPKMRKCKQLLGRISSSPSSTVLLMGETGTGKDLAAKAIHEGSNRVHGPFVNITCTALSQPLLESELFGHERGAFTDAKVRKKGLLAHGHGGTVFLDEIGEMEPSLQAKILRVIEEKTFRPVGGSSDTRTDVRVIAATNIDLRDAVRRRSFREDLYYRLAVLTVDLPPLRDVTGHAQ